MTRKEIQQAPTVAVWSRGLAGLEIKGMEYGMEETVLCVWTGDNSAHRCKVRRGRRGPYFLFHRRRVYLDECLRRTR